MSKKGPLPHVLSITIPFYFKHFGLCRLLVEHSLNVPPLLVLSLMIGGAVMLYPLVNDKVVIALRR
jgi:hypothetical protein